MIFSKTATREDLKTLKIQDLIDRYATIPKLSDNWDGALYKFWDYAMVLSLPDIKNTRLLNLYHKTDDPVFRAICNDNNIEYISVNIENVFDLLIRTNKYKTVCCIGSLDHSEFTLRKYINKLYRHVSLDGYLAITTDEQSLSKHKTKTISVNDLLDMSLILEQFGFEFVSNHKSLLVNYDDNAKNVPHSLIMKRVGQ